MALISEAVCERSSMVTPVSAFLCCVCVQVLVGMELIFFIVPGMGLFGICAGTSVDNIGMLIAEQVLCIKAFPASHLTPPVRRLRVHKELGEDTARTADCS